MNDIISSRWLQAFGAALLLLCFAARPAHAVSITLGSRIDITSSTFALPIQIVDADGVSEWFLDLTYDPTDVQVNVDCDPFSGDIYCSLFTGPVTEGDFFAAGAPFNLLIPGFVELDPITFAQSGRLFGLHGAFGGGPTAPSGSGILAYIQFIVLGSADSPIDVDGSTDGGGTGVPVSEPGTLALFAIGLAWLIGRRTLTRDRRRAAVALGALVSLSICGNAAAQFGPPIDLPSDLPTVMPSPTTGFPPTVASTQPGTYSAPPAWSQTLAPNVRFVILSNFNGEAVLDRETGLIWSRRSLGRAFAGTIPNFFDRPIEVVEGICQRLAIGNKYGWRLPAVAELQSLMDMSVPLSSAPSLPVGHPFWLSPGGANPTNSYWTAEAFFTELSGERIFVRRAVELAEGRSNAFRTPQTAAFVLRADMLCVRGGPTPAPNAPDSPR